MAKKKQNLKDTTPAWQKAMERAKDHHLFGELLGHIRFIKKDDIKLIEIHSKGYIYFNSTKNFSVSDWVSLFEISALHLFLNFVNKKSVNRQYEIAALIETIRFWQDIGGSDYDLPHFLKLDEEKHPYINMSLAQLEDKFFVEGIPDELESFSLNPKSETGALIFKEEPKNSVYSYYDKPKDYTAIFASALKENLRKTFDLMGKKDGDVSPEIAEAKNWLLKYFPLVGVLVNRFTIVEDGDICERMKIRFGAVNGHQKEIYINPKVYDAGLDQKRRVENAIWMLAHLGLHIVMQHRARGVGRDRWYWNLACEIVIEGWLKSMQVGIRPNKVLAFDTDIDNGITDDIYEEILKEPRIARKWESLKGEHPDVLDDDESIYGLSHDESAVLALLKRGYDLQVGRGDIPAGLEEEIKVLIQPAIAWEVELAHWMGTYIPQAYTLRSYSHPSRRQSTTPDIPRARAYRPTDEKINVTFGVIVDTSGSMIRSLLGKVLGTVAGYAQDKSVEEVRLVYCDSEAYDAGYVAVSDLSGRITVTGRGGTTLQRAVDLLEGAKDFPKNAPILILTDGFIDDLSIHRPHAYVLPAGSRLPYKTEESIFYVK